MIEKLVYFISSFSLLFWTVFSNKKSLDEILAYVSVVTMLLAVELVTSIIWEKKKNRKKRQGIYIMLFLLNVGAAVSYCASNCRAFANDLIYLILIFAGVYFLTCCTDWYESKNLGFFAMIFAPFTLIGALICKPVNGAHIKFFGILILPLVVLLYQTAICWFLKGHSRGYVGGKVGSLSSKNVGFLCYTVFLFPLIAMCNEFNLLILIALLGTAFFWYSIPDLKIRMAYIGLCLGTAFLACKFVSHIRVRLEVWLDLPKAVTDEALVGKTESIVYFLKNIQRSGWWGLGPGNLSIIFKTTCDTDHALTRIFYDYGILMGILVITAAVLLVRWMTTIRTLDTMEEFWTLGSIIVTGTILLLHIGSNTGGFISAGVSLPLASRGLCLNAMFVSYIAVELGFMEKGEKRNVQKKEKLQSYINQVWRLFKITLVIVLVLAIILGSRYLEADAKTAMSEQELDSTLLSLSEVYTPGTIYDKKGNVLMFGSTPGKFSWMSDKKSDSLERLIGGTEYTKAVETGNVRMTILGMAPELLGESDSRTDKKSLFHPNEKRIGGNVKLTIDADLQNFIENLLMENGYMDSSVMVSNFKTGEVEAAVCLGGDSSETVFSRKFHPASTMKLAIAASALEYDANLVNFSYTCKGNNTFPLDAEGKETVSVHCSSGNVHGTLTTMQSAMAQSCNGYFIALAQQVPEEILRENLKKFGFDEVMHFDSFKFNDNTFMGESENAYDLVYGCIGQGQASVTTIGLNMYTNAILNKGVLAEPHFILESNQKRGEPMKTKTQVVTKQMCTEEVADSIKNMMVGVMKEGTGRDFVIDGVETAFKTGTGEEGDGKTQTLLVTGGILDENKPYSITVCFNHVNGGSSVNAGLIAKEIVKRLVTEE